MSNFSEIANINFELSETKTWGLEKAKFGDGFSLPLILDEETATTIKSMVEEHGAKNPIYGATEKHQGTLYLKIKNISKKQKTELLDKGKANILVNFALTGTYTSKDDKKYLVFKTLRLRKLEKTEPEDEAPQD